MISGDNNNDDNDEEGNDKKGEKRVQRGGNGKAMRCSALSFHIMR